MQDGANPSSQENQAQHPQNAELGPPKSIPMGDPHATDIPVRKAPPIGEPMPQQQGQQNGNQQDPPASEGEAYWRGVAEQARMKAQKFDMYSSLINHFEQNPQDVDQLSEMILGGAQRLATAQDLAQQGGRRAPTQEELLSQELGLDGDSSNQQATAQPQVRQQASPQALIERARQEAAAEERAKIAFENFQSEMMEGGVPDHAIDEFVQFLRDPSALSFYDLFTAYNAHRIYSGKEAINMPQRRARVPRQNASAPQQQGQGPQQRPPVPVHQMQGGSERPGGEPKYQTHEGSRRIPNPNEI